MNKLSEEERKGTIEFIIRDLDALNYNENFIGVIKETWDLYKQEKEKNNRLQEYIKENEIYKTNLFKSYEEEQEKNKELLHKVNVLEIENDSICNKVNKDYISKAKIKEYVKQCDWHDDDVYIGEDILELLEE